MNLKLTGRTDNKSFHDFCTRCNFNYVFV